MSKTVAIVAGGIIVTLGLLMLFNRSAGENTAATEQVTSERIQPAGASGSSLPRTGSSISPASAKGEESAITKEEFEKMPKADQNKAMEAFVARFWASESGAAHDTASAEQHISLDLFGRPYMNTITEDQFQKLSPQDQEKAMTEITESSRQTRSQLKDTLAQAQICPPC